MDPEVADVLKKITKGEWRDALPRPLFSQLNDWFEKHIASDVVVRIVFYDPEKERRFACHLLCAKASKRNVHNIFIPEAEEFDSQVLLSVPRELRELPIFCMPHNMLERAVRKKRRKKL